jgi:hypothetical protein
MDPDKPSISSLLRTVRGNMKRNDGTVQRFFDHQPQSAGDGIIQTLVAAPQNRRKMFRENAIRRFAQSGPDADIWSMVDEAERFADATDPMSDSLSMHGLESNLSFLELLARILPGQR